MNDLKIAKLAIDYKTVTSLNPYKNNPRTHSKKQIEQIKRSIETFGFTNPILIDNENGIIAGHGRVEAAKLLSMESVPTIRLDQMSEAQKRAYIIADNKLAENAGWDEDLLKIELSGLLALDADFDLTLTGFEAPEIDFYLRQHIEDDEEIVELPAIPITQEGDIWQLGPHKIICGDSTKIETFQQILGSEKARLIFTDPPYNVPVDGHVCGNGSIKHAEFAMASGEMSPDEFTAFLKTIIDNLKHSSMDGSIHYICMDWRHMKELLEAGNLYSELKNLCIWNKTTGGMGSLYRSQHELVFVFKNGKQPHINNIELGKHGRYRTNVWDYPGVNNFSNAERMKELSMHPTVKPTKMVADAILDCSLQNDIILDCFGGSGTTLIAAHQTDRRARLIELDPRYVDVTIERFQRMTGLLATHHINGKSYDELKNSVNEMAHV